MLNTKYVYTVFSPRKENESKMYFNNQDFSQSCQESRMFTACKKKNLRKSISKVCNES